MVGNNYFGSLYHIAMVGNNYFGSLYHIAMVGNNYFGRLYLIAMVGNKLIILVAFATLLYRIGNNYLVAVWENFVVN